MPAAEFLDNERNWRTHPYAQRRALMESLERVGIADVLVAHYSERNGGKLTLIDGHARREEADVDWPTVILDVNDEEADLLLLTLDPTAAMAEADTKALQRLLDDVQMGTPALEDMLRGLAAAELDLPEGLPEFENPVPEMELQTFEHYDYIVLLFRNALDWSAAKEKLGVREEAFTLRDGKTRKLGLGRVVDGARVLGLLG